MIELPDTMDVAQEYWRDDHQRTKIELACWNFQSLGYAAVPHADQYVASIGLS